MLFDLAWKNFFITIEDGAFVRRNRPVSCIKKKRDTGIHLTNQAKIIGDMERNNAHIKLTVLISVADVLTDLKNRGYKLRFRRHSTCLYCPELYLQVSPDLFNVDESYHFEEVSSPDGDRVLYAISGSNGIKGFLVDTYGVYNDNMSLEMTRKFGAQREDQINVYQNGIMNTSLQQELKFTY